MASNIEKLIEDMENYIDTQSKPAAFSSSKIVINRDELEQYLQELKETTEKQNEIIVKQTKSIETLTKQVKDLQSTIDSMSQDMITTPDGDDITTG